MIKARTFTIAALLAATILVPAAWAVDPSKVELAQLQKAVDTNPTSPDAHFDLAMALARTDRPEEGLDELKKVNQLDPGYADKVISKYKPMVDQNNKNVEAYFRLGFGYYFKGVNLQQSADALKDKDKVQAGSQYAEAAKNKALARSAFETIIQNDPKYVPAYNYLAYLIYEGGDVNKSIDILRQSIKVQDNAVAHLLLGQAFIRQNNFLEGATETATGFRMRGLTP